MSEYSRLKQRLAALGGKVGFLSNDSGRELAVVVYRGKLRGRKRGIAILCGDDDTPLPEFEELRDVVFSLFPGKTNITAERGKFEGYQVWRVWEVFADEADGIKAEVLLFNSEPQGNA